MFHSGISNWKSLLASHLYRSVKHIISGHLNRKNEIFPLCYVPHWGFSSFLSRPAKLSFIWNSRSLGALMVTSAGLGFCSRENIHTTVWGCSLAFYHGGEVNIESCTVAFHRQATAGAKCNTMSKLKHFSYASASKLFWMVLNWLQNHQTTEKIVCFSGNKWRYFSDNRTFWWKIVRFFTNFIFQVKIPNGVESSDVAINISESELCLTEHECSHILPRWCS